MKMTLKIVYLDDEPELCMIFEELLASPQVTIKVFSDPKLAVAEIVTHPPDLIFLDFRLPNTTGDEVALGLKNDIPKFLITGDIFVDTKYPFVKVFQKPIDPDKIQKVISEYMESRQAA